ncbi:MAG: hypothetical protein DPW12_11695 [Rhodocyclaceae bacterium]|nr:hypothetical protein [Rhodocyclaceae bacterium]HNQ56326.1 hypothetical protein [Candidatus Desulfobacillus denitrificans]HNT61634.1 hypothetical protein [Candidatus Desulfobacillus denitrificans]
MTNESIERCISRWQAAGGSERANYLLFVGELTELLGLPRPDPLADADLAARFTGKGPWKKRLPQLLDTLVALGRARVLEDGRWMG